MCWSTGILGVVGGGERGEEGGRKEKESIYHQQSYTYWSTGKPEGVGGGESRRVEEGGSRMKKEEDSSITTL